MQIKQDQIHIFMSLSTPRSCQQAYSIFIYLQQNFYSIFCLKNTIFMTLYIFSHMLVSASFHFRNYLCLALCLPLMKAINIRNGRIAENSIRKLSVESESRIWILPLLFLNCVNLGKLVYLCLNFLICKFGIIIKV